MVKSIMTTIRKKRFVIEIPMTIAKIQSSILRFVTSSCEILSEADIFLLK